jgi:hypothetical protein
MTAGHARAGEGGEKGVSRVSCACHVRHTCTYRPALRRDRARHAPSTTAMDASENHMTRALVDSLVLRCASSRSRCRRAGRHRWGGEGGLLRLLGTAVGGGSLPVPPPPPSFLHTRLEQHLLVDALHAVLQLAQLQLDGPQVLVLGHLRACGENGSDTRGEAKQRRIERKPGGMQWVASRAPSATALRARVLPPAPPAEHLAGCTHLRVVLGVGARGKVKRHPPRHGRCSSAARQWERRVRGVSKGMRHRGLPGNDSIAGALPSPPSRPPSLPPPSAHRGW